MGKALEAQASSQPLAFGLLWACQLASLLGTDVSSFALRVWTYQLTGSVTKFSIITLFAELPGALVSPLAGAVVDRYSRKSVLLGADMVSGLATAAVCLLFMADRLAPWHIYAANITASIMGALQWPAFKATVALLVPPDQLARYGGLNQAAPALSMLLSPAVAGVVVSSYGLSGAFAVEFLTLVVALVVTAAAHIPNPPSTEEGLTADGTTSQVKGAWGFIKHRKGLVGLLGLLVCGNLTSGMVRVLMTPVILNLGGGASMLGYVLSVSGCGALVGSLMLAVWGGPKVHKVYAVLACVGLQGLILAACGLSQDAKTMLALSGLYMTVIPLNRACRESIWQAKTPPDLAGRVFGLQRAVVEFSAPVAAAIAGPLADQFFEPGLRGSALLFVALGAANALTALVGSFYGPLRRVDTELSDAALGNKNQKHE